MKYLYFPMFDQWARDVVRDDFQAAFLSGRIGGNDPWPILYMDDSLARLGDGDELFIIAHGNNERRSIYNKLDDELTGGQLANNLITNGLRNKDITIRMFACLSGVREHDDRTFAGRLAAKLGRRNLTRPVVVGYVGFVSSHQGVLRVVKKVRLADGGVTGVWRKKASTEREVHYNMDGQVISGTEGRRINRGHGIVRIKNV